MDGPKNIFQAISTDGEWDFEPPVDGAPTTAPPGTRRKIDELAARMQRGEPLWHDDDNTYEGVLGSPDIPCKKQRQVQDYVKPTVQRLSHQRNVRNSD